MSIILDATTKTIKVIMSGVAATTNPDFVAAWADNNGTTFAEGASDGALNGTTDVTAVAAPAASTRRIIKSLYIENRDTAAVTLTIKYDNNGTQRTIAKVTLQVGDTWSTDGTYDTNGSLKEVIGSVNLATQVSGVLPVANGGTNASTSSITSFNNITGYTASGATGTTSTNLVFSTSPSLTTPVLGTPSSGTLTNCTGLPASGIVSGTTPTSTTITLGENSSIALDPAGSADGKYTGITIAGTAGTTLAFGNLCYLAVADSRWELADADAAATAAGVMLGMCVLAAAGDGSATTLLLLGQIRADTAFPALTIGAVAYVGETAGAIQVAIPTGADNIIRPVGFALTADEIYFNPSQDSQVTVA